MKYVVVNISQLKIWERESIKDATTDLQRMDRDKEHGLVVEADSCNVTDSTDTLEPPAPVQRGDTPPPLEDVDAETEEGAGDNEYAEQAAGSTDESAG